MSLLAVLLIIALTWLIFKSLFAVLVVLAICALVLFLVRNGSFKL